MTSPAESWAAEGDLRRLWLLMPTACTDSLYWAALADAMEESGCPKWAEAARVLSTSNGAFLTRANNTYYLYSVYRLAEPREHILQSDVYDLFNKLVDALARKRVWG